MRFLDKIPFSVLLIATLTLGLAPFLPQPHLFEKLRMLFSGDLLKPLDFFDLLLHGFSPTLLFVKLARMLLTRR